MSYIIHGASGSQGKALFARLVAAGKDPVAVVRNTGKVTNGPTIAVDLNSGESLVDAYRGAESVFVYLPVAAESQRVQFARNIVSAMNEAKPSRVVVLTSGAPIDLPGVEDTAVMKLVSGIRESGISHAIVAPRLYFENLLLPFVIEGVRSEGVLRYPIRDDFRVSWSSHSDVAEVVERLLTDHNVTGVVELGHVPGLFGKDLAAGFGRYFGRPVSFEAMTPQELGKRITPLYGDAAAAGVVGLYETLWQAPQSVIQEQTSAQALLGLRPIGVEDWLQQTL